MVHGSNCMVVGTGFAVTNVAATTCVHRRHTSCNVSLMWEYHHIDSCSAQMGKQKPCADCQLHHGILLALLYTCLTSHTKTIDRHSCRLHSHDACITHGKSELSLCCRERYKYGALPLLWCSGCGGRARSSHTANRCETRLQAHGCNPGPA